MAKNRACYCIMLLFFIASSCLHYACSPRSNEQKSVDDFSASFSLYILNKTGSNNFIILDKLDSLSQQIETSIPSATFNREFILKGRSFFQLNYKTNQFVRYDLSEKNILFAKDSISLGKVGDVEHFIWKENTDTLMLFTVLRDQGSTGFMHVLDTKSMTLVQRQRLPLPKSISAGYDQLNIGVVDYDQEKLWVGYSYSKYLADGDYTTSDSMYFSAIDMRKLTLKSTYSDARSTYPGGINTVQSYAAKNESGDLYFMSCPGIALGNRLDAPTAIFRKKQGDNALDPNYMIDISQKIGNHAYGFWYIGNQQAIIRSEQKDKYTDFSNHHSTYQFEYYLVDLENGNFHKLALPLDKGTRKENVIVDGDKVYFAIDDKDDNHAIWQYSIKQQTIEKLLNLSKSIDFIVRMDRLK